MLICKNKYQEQARIFDHEPDSWQELEIMVCQAFSEMGYASSRGNRIETVRGKVAVDVLAKNTSASIPITIVCECKYWKNRVNQQVIYAFRSICADIGAHIGLVISKAGFQSGASESRESTNIHIIDFTEFQSLYFQEWRSGVFREIIRLRDQLLPLIYRKTDYLPEVNYKYEIFEEASRFFIMDESFPVRLREPRTTEGNEQWVTVNTHREYFEVIKEAFELHKSGI